MPKQKSVPRETKQLGVIGRAFRIRRLDQKLKLLDVEEQSGVTALTISKLEKGELDNISIITLNKIASSLGLKISLTIENTEAPQSN